MPVSEPIDQQRLDALLADVGGDVVFLADLAEAFFADAPGLFDQMRQSLDAGSAEGLRRSAHSLKSNSSNFGAVSLARLSKELEDLGKASYFEGAAGRIDQAEAEYRRVEAALRDILAGKTQGSQDG